MQSAETDQLSRERQRLGCGYRYHRIALTARLQYERASRYSLCKMSPHESESYD